ncbi:MAG TPA: DHHA1 domain-containing protein [Streptosporangiaceae bacterium]|nr:DHHA1 domain-containing protein [Streptosporangiaceae bacterium]
MTTSSDWARAVKVIDGAGQVCLACHVRPDADALGSMLAVLHALRSRLGSRPAGSPAVVASFGDDPFEVPAILRFLPGIELLTAPADYPVQPDVMLSFDAASIDRLGALTDRATAAAELIVLDHHVSNTKFGSINLVDPAAAATAVLAATLIDGLGVPLTEQIALGLYAGLATDTGSFKFSATTPEVHELAARLLATGIDPGAVSRELYDRAPFTYIHMLASALARAVLERETAGGLGLVWTTVTRADRVQAGLSLDAAESVIDEIRRTDEAEVAVVLKEDDAGVWQVSMRSKSLADVRAIASALGGGGHARAAGFSFAGAADEAVRAVRTLLDHA